MMVVRRLAGGGSNAPQPWNFLQGEELNFTNTEMRS